MLPRSSSRTRLYRLSYQTVNIIALVLFTIFVFIVASMPGSLVHVLVIVGFPVLLIRFTLSESEYRRLSAPLLTLAVVVCGTSVWALLSVVQRHNLAGY